MLVCPACGAENPDGANQCQRCHLAAGLFDAVREAVGLPDTHPQYLDSVAEVLQAVDASHSPDAAPREFAGVFARPARFLAPPAPLSASTEEGGPRAMGTIPELRALPPGSDLTALRRQVDEYLQLARRQGIDLSDLSARAKQAVLTQNRGSFEVLSRDLFVHLAASLTDRYDEVLAKRNEVAQIVPTPTPDAELESCRTALSHGDLSGAQRRLRHIEESLADIEDEWATVQILTTEADLLAETVRELGGDPTPALGPLEEGRRLARLGQREEAEPVLARSTFALWSILNPLFAKDLARLKEAVLLQKASRGDVGPAVTELRELATNLRHRNFAAAVAAYRRLRDVVDVRFPGGAPPDPEAVAGSPPSPG